LTAKPTILSSGPTERRQSSVAFTILEMVMAIAILAIGVVSVMGLYVSAVRQFKDAANSSQIALLSEFALAEAQNHLENNDPPTGINWARHTNFPGFEYKITFTATSLEGEYRVEVVIGWGPEKPPPHTVERFEYEERFHTVLLKP